MIKFTLKTTKRRFRIFHIIFNFSRNDTCRTLFFFTDDRGKRGRREKREEEGEGGGRRGRRKEREEKEREEEGEGGGRGGSRKGREEIGEGGGQDLKNYQSHIHKILHGYSSSLKTSTNFL